MLVFAEVKTRSSAAFGLPAEAVNRTKSARIRQLALRWMAEQRDAPGAAFWSAVRFDVVCVLRGRDGFDVTHLTGAF